MKGLPVLLTDYRSFFSRLQRDMSYNKEKMTDYLGLFTLLVAGLGLLCFIGDTSMTRLDATILQALGFLLLGVGHQYYLQRKLKILFNRNVRLFSPEYWYFIVFLCLLLVLLLFLLYLVLERSQLLMALVSLRAFLLPFALGNPSVLFRITGSASLFLFLGFSCFLTAGQATPYHDQDEAPPVAPVGKTGNLTTKYNQASILLSGYTGRLLELDAQFARLVRSGTGASPADLAKASRDIKTMEASLGKALDSLDRQGHESGVLVTPFRSLLAGHRIMTSMQSDRAVDNKIQPDSPGASSQP